MTMAFLLFAVLAILAGFKLISSGGNPGALKEAKGSFANAFIGLLIILSAWLIVDTLLRKLLPSGNGEISGYGPWSSVQCATQTVADTSGSFEGDAIYYAADIETAGPGSTINNGGTSVPTVPPSNMTSLRAIGVKVASWSGTNGPGRTDLTHPTVAQTILRMQNQWKASHADKYPFQVTAAYTNSVGHSSGSQHYTGKAVDLQPVSGGASYDEIIKMCRSAGFTFVNDERAVHHIHCDMR